MTAHATFAPSSAARWIACPGSVALCSTIERTSSKYADEGTAAHILATRAFTYDESAAFFMGAEIQVGGAIYVVNEDMAGYIQAYLDDVRGRVAGGTLMVEQRMEFSETIGIPEQFGTGDAVILTDNGETLIVEDLKYGLGVRVFAQGNEQGLMYLVAALETYAPILGDVKRFRFVVHQPRLDHVDEAEYTRAEIDDFIEKMKLAAQHAQIGLQALEIDGMQTLLADDALFCAGDKQCRFCPALATCPTAARKVAAEVYDDFKALEKPDELLIRGAPQVPAGEKLGWAYGVIDFVEGWCRAVRGECERMVLAGMTVIGPDGLAMKIVEGKRGNRFWWDEEGAEAALQGLLPPEKIYRPQEIISVAAAEKVLGKKRKADFEQALVPFIRQKDGALKVVLGSDPAPAYVGEASAAEFPMLPETT